MRALIKQLDKLIDILIIDNPILIHKVIKHFLKLLKMLHRPDFPPDDLIVEICQHCDQKGYHQVIHTEEQWQDYHHIDWVVLYIFIEDIDHILLGKDYV
jgi:hypothetical protein